MTVEKLIENGMTYRVETEGATMVKMKVEPLLLYGNIPASVSSGEVVTIPMHLEDFDGELRHDDLDVTFLVDGEQMPVPMTGGNLTLELELVTRGHHRVAAVPLGISMTPIEIEVG